MQSSNLSAEWLSKHPARERQASSPKQLDEGPPALAAPDHELIQQIGAGAYGDVWLARNAVGTLRAVKFVHRLGAELNGAFEREFKGLQTIEPISRLHEGLVDILQIGRNEAAGYFYYVMELADADGEEYPCHSPQGYAPRTLRSLLGATRSVQLMDCIALGIKLSAALEFLHQRQLVHRDVKPSNIIYVKGEPKLADIGLVARIDEARSLVGTVGYIPPEGPGTPQGDIFSLGKALYEAAFGKDRQEFPQLPHDLELHPDHNGLLELNEIILKACESDPRKRYVSAEEMRRELESLAIGRSVRQARALNRRKRLIGVAIAWLAVGAFILGALAFVGRHRQDNVDQRDASFSTNETANQYLHLGTIYLDKLRGTNFAVAADYFQKAIDKDPNFAQAYAALAAVYSWSDGEWNPNWKYFPKAKELALRALAIDKSLARPHGILSGYYALMEWDWPRAMYECKLALNRDPTSVESHLSYAEVLRMLGRTNEALDQLRLALDRDPHSITLAYRLAGYLVDARRYQEALGQVDQIEALDSNLNFNYSRYRALCGLGRYGEAIEAERKSAARTLSAPVLEQRIGRLVRGFTEGGAAGYWQAKLENAKDAADTYGQACACAQLGRAEEAFPLLQKLLEERSTDLTFQIMSDARLDGLRADPRFHLILKQMRLDPPPGLVP